MTAFPRSSTIRRRTFSKNTKLETLQTRFLSRHYESVDGKIFDARQRIFVPEVYRRLQDSSEFYLDVEGPDIKSALVGSNSTDILDRGRVSSVAHNNYKDLEKLLFKHKRF